VFDRARALLTADPSLSGDAAYWLARKEIDKELELEP
jgi:hypothetical protein